MVVLCIISCNNNLTREMKIGNQIVRSNFIQDSILDGETKFYSLDSVLENITFFKQGIPNGLSISFYKNGKIRDSMIYINGFKEGRYHAYDSYGSILYSDYYFHNHLIGERKLYKEGLLSNYSFFDFEGRLLYSCDYDSIGIRRATGEILNANINSVFQGNTDKKRIFIYFIAPDGVDTDYKIGIVDSSGKYRKELCGLNHLNRMFIDTIVNKLSNNFSYFVSLDYNDRQNDFHKVYIIDLK